MLKKLFSEDEIDNFIDTIKEDILWKTAKSQVVISILKDAQKQLNFGLNEQAAKTINIANYILSREEL